jgi:phosphopantetheinyl transferase
MSTKTDMRQPFQNMVSEINLWIATFEESVLTLPFNYNNILSFQEMQKSRKFRRESDRQQYLFSHILLRMALSQTTNGRIKPGCWQIIENRQGKPVIDAFSTLPSLHFSLSRSEGVAVVAVSPACPVGVDVEPANRNLDIHIMEMFLSEGERIWLNNLPSEIRCEDFIRLWTLKEAYAKFLGTGLFLDFASLEISLNPVRLVRTEAGESHPADLHLETQEIQTKNGSYCLSLAARRPSFGKLKITLQILDSRLIETFYNDMFDTAREYNVTPSLTTKESCFNIGGKLWKNGCG